MAGLRGARRATQIALLLAFIVLSGVIVVASVRLFHQDGLDASINVNWPVWWLCVAGSYIGLGLVGWWVVERDLQHPGQQRPPDTRGLTITQTD